MDEYNLWQLGVVAVFAAYIAWRYWPRRSTMDLELEIVVHAAARLDGGPTARNIVSAALCNPGVAAAVERAGSSVDDVRRALATIEDTSEDLDSLRSRALSEALNELASGDGPVGRLLAQLDVDFEDTLLATTIDAAGPPSGSVVYLWNDAVTPMPDVAELLRTTFDEDSVAAEYITLSVHHRGYAMLGPYDEETAATLLADGRAFIASRDLQLQIRSVAPDTSEWRMTDHGLLP